MLKNWNFLRVLRLVLGIFILVQGVTTWEIPFIILGAVFTAMPLFNVGCCGTSACANGNCYVPTKVNTDGTGSAK